MRAEGKDVMKPGARIAVVADGKDRAATSLAVQDAHDTVKALVELGYSVSFHDCNTAEPNDLAPLFKSDFDLVYVAGTAPFTARESPLGFNPLECIQSPIMVRVSDPLYHARFSHIPSQFQNPVIVSGKDQNLADYLALAGIQHRGVGYCPGRYDPADYPTDQAARRLETRDIPYLFVASFARAKPFADLVDQGLPGRRDLLSALIDALERETVKPAWRVAETLYATLAPELRCHQGLGRLLLEAATRIAANRIRLRMVQRLCRHPGLIITNQDPGALDLPSDSRAKIVSPQPVTQVEALRFRARVSVCPLAHLSVGAVSERVYRSMAAGSVVLAPRIPAMDTHFDAGTHYLCFDRDFSGFEEQLADAAEIDAGRGNAAAQEVADAGRARAEAEFSARIATERMLMTRSQPPTVAATR